MESLSTPKGERLEALVLAHQGYVRGYLSVLGCPGRLLDDLSQEVFLSLLRSGFVERGPGQSKAYLRKVARHLLLKTLRRERRLPSEEDLDAAEAAWDGFARDDDGEGYLDALRACLARLEERVRGILHLCYGEEVGRAAIGARVGLSEEGVKSVLARAKRSLRACVERRLAS